MNRPLLLVGNVRIVHIIQFAYSLDTKLKITRGKCYVLEAIGSLFPCWCFYGEHTLFSLLPLSTANEIQNNILDNIDKYKIQKTKKKPTNQCE